MVRRSTLPLDDPAWRSSAIAGDGVFDFAIPGTVIRLAGARYYYADDVLRGRHPDPGDRTVGDFSGTRPLLAAIDSADAELRARSSRRWLARWATKSSGRRRTSGCTGVTTKGPAGCLWLKDDMVHCSISLETDRMTRSQGEGLRRSWGVDPVHRSVGQEGVSLDRALRLSITEPLTVETRSRDSPERRKVRSCRTPSSPGPLKEIEEICGKGIPYEVDWDSIAGDINALNFLDNISCASR